MAKKYIDAESLYEHIVRTPSDTCSKYRSISEHENLSTIEHFLHGAMARQREILTILEEEPAANVQEKHARSWEAVKAYDEGYVEGQNHKWISVDDRLPTESGEYIVTVREPVGDEETSFVLNAWYRADRFPYEKDIGWDLLNEFYPYSEKIREHITHWMPMPEPFGCATPKSPQPF